MKIRRENKLNIVYSTDENYAKFCLASLASLIESNKNKKNIKIYIIENELSQKTKQKMEELVQNNGKIIFINYKNDYQNLASEEYPFAGYARLFIQDKIKEDKVIYLDCDLIVKNDLEELYNIEMGENWIGGVQDPCGSESIKIPIGMDINDRYINAGVLLINLKKWREIDFKKLVIEFIKKHNGNVAHRDQGIINGICKGHILYLNPKYNLMPEMIMMKSEELKKIYKMKEFYTDEDLKKAKENPTIVHFIRKVYNRPWFIENPHPYQKDFLQYYEKFGGKLESSPLPKKVRTRIFIYQHFPFPIYFALEKILEYKRKKKTLKNYKQKI